MSRLRTLLSERLAARVGSPAHTSLPTVAVPMANNPEVIGAIGEVMEIGIARFVLIGPRAEIEATVGRHHVDLKGTELLEAPDGPSACREAALLASCGRVQVLMKGLVQTADFVRSVLDKELHLVLSGGLLSHVALCEVPGFDRLFLLTDAAIATYPDVAQKRMIIENAVAVARSLGWMHPKVALVAPVEKVSPKIPNTTDAAQLVEAYRDDERFAIGGPFGLDVAISRKAASVKGIGGPVAGAADILVVPNIDAGNVLYKALTGFAHAHIAGIVAGASVPMVLTSRADTEESKADSLRFALAALSR